MTFNSSVNATPVITLVNHPWTCQYPRIGSLGRRPIPYSLNSTPEITGPHRYLSTHLYDCYCVLFMRWLFRFVYLMFIVSMWGLISSIYVTAIDKTLGWIIFLFRTNVVVMVHNMYYVISCFFNLKMLYAELFQLFLPHYQWKLLCKT